MASMTIAGLAREGGVGVETVRYYQRRGLLGTPDRPGASSAGGGIRRYSAADARRLRFIRYAQAAGFTLEQIGELLALDATDDRARARQLANEGSLHESEFYVRQARTDSERANAMVKDRSPV
ncbi:MAG: MerR family mercuric resistance operon transcriptional regulator [Sphingomonas echinoides]|jgi:MerR family mercuric resistance operon transcriptional regulator